MDFWIKYFVARLRGLFCGKYNKMPLKNSGVSCGINKVSEIKIMFYKHNWIPYCITSSGSSYISDQPEDFCGYIKEL